tara:strand:- start:694 stop:960 length:267 start_codon:yes stop_codon:yes gene_type:complete
MDENKLKEIFTSASNLEPIYRGFMAIIADHLEFNKRAAFSPNLTAEDRAYNCGRCASLEDLLFTIEGYDAKNNLTEEGEEPTSKQSLS